MKRYAIPTTALALSAFLLTACFEQEQGGPDQTDTAVPAQTQTVDVDAEAAKFSNGTVDQLNHLWSLYQTKGDADKEAIAAFVRSTFASVDTLRFPGHLQVFLTDVGAR